MEWPLWSRPTRGICRRRRGFGFRRCRRRQFSSLVEVATRINSDWSCQKDPTGKRCGTCRLPPCDEDVSSVVLRRRVAWNRHMITVHGVPCSSSKIPGSVETWSHWCGLRGRYLSQLREDLDDHVAQHEQIMGEIIHAEGFTGLMLRQMTTRPPLNPFDVYDTSILEFGLAHIAECLCVSYLPSNRRPIPAMTEAMTTLSSSSPPEPAAMTCRVRGPDACDAWEFSHPIDDLDVGISDLC